jgi:hypothetical protein
MNIHMQGGPIPGMTAQIGGQHNDWSTRATQCDPPADMQEWFLAMLCFQCAQASAKSKADGTHCFYNLLCWHHGGTVNWIRRGYGIQGTCGDDMAWSILCYPCAVRRVLTESKVRGQWRQIGNSTQDNWLATTFGCSFCGIVQATICPFCVAHEARLILQPQPGSDDMCFDWMCLIPFALYGLVRHAFNLRSDCGLLEDVAFPLILYPCALDRARRECINRLTTAEYMAYHAIPSGMRISVPGVGNITLKV